MRDGDLLDRLASELEAAGQVMALDQAAARLLMTGDAALGARVLKALLARDERFQVRDGRVALKPVESPFGGVPLAHLDFAVLDFETNGLAEDRAIEVGVVCMRDGLVTGSFSSLLDPGTPVAPFVTRMTGIAREDLAGQPAFADVWPLLRERLAGRVLVAHNLPFDRRVLRHEVAVLGGDRRVGHHAVCTLRLARRLLPREEPKSLDALAERFGLTFVARHRALGDAAVTGELLFRLLNMAAGQAPMGTWDDLEAFMTAPSPGRRPGAPGVDRRRPGR